MSLLRRLFGKSVPEAVVYEDPFNNLYMTPQDATHNYQMTDDGLQALVDGKLVCQKVPETEPGIHPGTFYIAYDSIVYDPGINSIRIYWKRTCISEIAVPAVVNGNTLTVDGLIGKMPMVIHR